MATTAFNSMKWVREAKLYLQLVISRLLTVGYVNRIRNE